VTYIPATDLFQASTDNPFEACVTHQTTRPRRRCTKPPRSFPARLSLPTPRLEAQLRQQVGPIFQRGHDDACEAADPRVEFDQRRFLGGGARLGFGLFYLLLDVGFFQALQIGVLGGEARLGVAHRRQFGGNGRVVLSIEIEDARSIEEGGLVGSPFGSVVAGLRGWAS
jgi:hypothetical protein